MSIENVLYYLFVAGMFFVMMRFGCGSHVMGHGHHHSSSAGGAPTPPPADDIDPVCGMTVATRTAKSSAYLGRVYYFHSRECRDKFEATPEAYAKVAALNQEHRHGC
jgi:YHS domain-containing protein